MLHPILGRILTNFFSEAVGEPLQAVTSKAPIDKQVRPLAQLSAADYGVGGVCMHAAKCAQNFAAQRRW